MIYQADIKRLLIGPRGFLFNYPADVCYVVNGHPVTRADILQGKQERQARQLARKRQSYEPVIKPAFVWVFDNGPIFPYGGKWLYVRTLKQSWEIRDDSLRLQIMSVFPCGLLPIIENYKVWQQAFIERYRHSDPRRPQGLVVCWAEISYSGDLKGIKL